MKIFRKNSVIKCKFAHCAENYGRKSPENPEKIPEKTQFRPLVRKSFWGLCKLSKIWQNLCKIPTKFVQNARMNAGQRGSHFFWRYEKLKKTSIFGAIASIDVRDFEHFPVFWQFFTSVYTFCTLCTTRVSLTFFPFDNALFGVFFWQKKFLDKFRRLVGKLQKQRFLEKCVRATQICENVQNFFSEFPENCPNFAGA